MRKLGITLGSKVILIFVGAFVLLGFLAWGFSKPWRGPWRDQMPKVIWINLRAHLIDIAADIGEPPTAEKAHEVLKDLMLEVMVRENGQTIFSTGSTLPNWSDIEEEVKEEVELRRLRPDSLRSRLGDFIIGRCSNRMFAVLDRNQRQFVFFLPERESYQAGLRAFSGFAFTIAFLLLVIFGVTNWLLRPLKPLMAGVAELSKGNLDYRVSIQPRGEFRRVADAFNDMAETLQRQIRSKDQLLMDVSHELRSPIGRIKMAAEMLPEGETRGELREQIQSDVREMEELVSELLQIYRMRDFEQKNESGLSWVANQSEVDLGELVRSVVGPLVEQRPGVEYRLKSELASTRALIQGDEKVLKRAVRNVVENAVKFSRHQAKPVEVTLETVGQEHILTVRDHGVGMTDEQCRRIFEPFYRADSSRVRETGGFGLGLALAQAVLAAHGGSIECESNLDQGATFRLRLPVSR